MPQPKKYANRAEQQAAYRKRRSLSERELLASKGLPSLPAIPTLPGHARWRTMLTQAQALLCAAAEEMQTYHDERSEAWQESANANELLAKLEHLQEIISHLEDYE